MPNITVNLTDAELSDADINLIRSSLGLPDATDMAPVLPRLFKSALIEYIKMFKEGGMPSKANEMMQERLFHLIVHYFDDIPDEHNIEDIFQITSAQSRTLLRNTESRYRTRITAIKRDRLRAVLATMNEDNGVHRFECTSTLIIEDLNKIVRLKGPTNSLITKERDTASTYRVPADTYNLLARELG